MKKENSNVIINLLEHGYLKQNENDFNESRVLCLHDNCSDSNWLSKNFAKTLKNASKKQVVLRLKTIPGKKEITTWEYQFYFKVKNQFIFMKAYECQEDIGFLSFTSDTQNALQDMFNKPIQLSSGNIDLLIGLKNFSLHPVASNIFNSQLPEIKVFRSVISEELTYLIAGALPRCLIKGVGAETVFYTIDELQQFLNQQKAIELPRVLCPTCRLRSKKCFKCNIMTRPMSLKEQKEIELIQSGMSFNKQKKEVTMLYKPITDESFDELFPPEYSNQNEAIAIATKCWKSLKKDGLIDQHAKAFQKFIDGKVFSHLTEKAMKDWDSQGKGSNFVTILPVRKEQTNLEKQSLRLVTNSSQSRWTNVGGQKVRSSLNSVLPKGCQNMNSLVDILLLWMENPISLILDQKRAYNVIKQASPQMSHLRRIAWFENPNCQSEKDLKTKFFSIDPVHYGDSPASSCLGIFRQQVINDLREKGKQKTAYMLETSSFVDDNAASLPSVSDAFQCFDETKDAFSEYGAEFHLPLISSKQGRFDFKNSKPRTSPNEDEEPEEKIFGYFYSSFKDMLRLPIQRNLHKKRKGLREGKDITNQEIRVLDLTMRKLSSFIMSVHDCMGFLNPVMVEGKILLSQVQKLLPPNQPGHWDRVLPLDLLKQGRSFIQKVVNLPDLVFPRSPPTGHLKQLLCFVDGAFMVFGLVVYGVWVDQYENKESKLLLSRNKISRRQIPDQELSGFTLGLEVLVNMKKLYKNVDEVTIFSDSEASVAQVKSTHRPKDIYKNNRYNAINAAFAELEEAGVKVEVLLVRSANQLADPVTKQLDSSVDLVQSKHWLKGPLWLSKKEAWPVEIPSQEVSQGNNETTDSFDQNDKVLVTKESLRSFVKKESNKPLPSSTSAPSTILPGPGLSAPPISTNDTKESPLQESLPDEPKEHLTQVDQHNNILDKAKNEATSEESSASIFDQMLKNVSSPRKATRIVARVLNMIKRKSFAALKEKLSSYDETQAWLCLCRDQQINMKNVSSTKQMAFLHNKVWCTRQRWSKQTHMQLFLCEQLPLLQADSRLGELLIQNAHREPGKVCKSNQHVLLHLKTSSTPAVLFGPLVKKLNQVRQRCAPCLKEKIRINNGAQSSFSPQMSIDRFKDTNGEVWSKISIDLIAPVEVTDQPNTRETRRQKRFTKKAILVIVDCSGIAAAKFVLMSSQSAASFTQALKQHIAQVGVVPNIIYADMGSAFIAVSEREKFKNLNEDVKIELEQISKDAMKTFPNIRFEIATSSSQYKNSNSELVVKAYKHFCRNSLQLKPNTVKKQFTNEGLQLLLSELSFHLNSRPISWINQTHITPNHFILPNHSAKQWSSEISIADKYIEHDKFKEKMRSELIKCMQQLTFLPKKWKEETSRAKVGDVCLIQRGIGKVNKLGILEYCKVLSVTEDGRKLLVVVSRTTTNEVKQLEVDSRLCHLVHRPEPI